jgi:biopolymer transport protein ExbD
MSLITIVITLIVVGVLLWLINTYIPMDGKIKNIINIVVVVAVVLWLLNVFGVLGNLRAVHVSIQPPARHESAYPFSTQPAAQI